jgi:hypothetical protein
VPRLKLLQHLDKKGCGNRYIKALASCLSNTAGLIGDETFCATSGVRQGASTSCPLFTFFLDATVDAVNQCEPDGWLGSTHMLLLMDDTAIVATSRQRMQEKLEILKRTTDQIGMTIHPTKSRFMSVNTSDCASFVLDDVVISHTNMYVYLGTPISPSSIKQQVDDHLKSKIGHVFKFASFLAKNSDAPFTVKKAVWESALKSSIFYSSETWLTEDLRATESIYMTTLKNLLHVRTTTCNDLVLTELGLGDAKSFIRQKQLNFIHKLISRSNYENSIVAKVVNLAEQERTQSGLLLKTLMAKDSNYDLIAEKLHLLHEKIKSSSSSRRITYLSINPELSVPVMYSCDPPIKEHFRVATTRLRLSSHRLKIETGRWSRIVKENRLCVCGQMQTEEHVLLMCPQTRELRDSHKDRQFSKII